MYTFPHTCYALEGTVQTALETREMNSGVQSFSAGLTLLLQHRFIVMTLQRAGWMKREMKRSTGSAVLLAITVFLPPALQEEACSCSEVTVNEGGGEREGTSFSFRFFREPRSKFQVEVAEIETKIRHHIPKAKLPGPGEMGQAGRGHCRKP